MNGAPLVPTGQTRLSPKAAETTRSIGCRVIAEWIALLLFLLSFQAQERSVTIGHCLWKKREGGVEEGKRRLCSTKPILKFLWKGRGRGRDEEEGGNYKNKCVPKTHLEARYSVCGQKTLFGSRCCLWWLCGSASPSLAPNHKPFPFLQDTELHVVKKEFYENQLIPFSSPPIVLWQRL